MYLEKRQILPLFFIACRRPSVNLSPSRTMNKDNQVLTQRREKADALAALGVNLYGNSFKPANSVQDLLPRGDSLQPEQAEPGNSRYSIAGRVLSLRKFGKAAFCHLADASGPTPGLPAARCPGRGSVRHLQEMGHRRHRRGRRHPVQDQDRRVVADGLDHHHDLEIRSDRCRRNGTA